MKNQLTLSILASCVLLISAAPASADDGARRGKDKSHQQSRHYDRDYARHDSRRGNARAKNRNHKKHNHRNIRDYRKYRHQARQYKRSYYVSDYRRAARLPRWLRYDRGFVRWYQYSHVRHDYRLSWQDLIDIYLWESSRRRYRHY